jgi:hypothetical protein
MLLLARRCVLNFRLGESVEWARFTLRLRGAKDPASGMILNLRIMDQSMERLSHMIEDRSEPFTTVLELMKQSLNFLAQEFRAYAVSVHEVELELPHLRSRYILTQEEQVFVEIFSYLRYRDLWGEALVRLPLQEFTRLRSAEWNASAWYLSMEATPTRALRSKFPSAQAWGFRELKTEQWEWLEANNYSVSKEG